VYIFSFFRSNIDFFDLADVPVISPPSLEGDMTWDDHAERSGNSDESQMDGECIYSHFLDQILIF
jgi:hypothetical protein